MSQNHSNPALQALASRLSHETLRAYLVKMGWESIPCPRAEIALYCYKRGGVVQVPINRGLVDYVRAIALAVEDIANTQAGCDCCGGYRCDKVARATELERAEALLTELVGPLYAACIYPDEVDELPSWVPAARHEAIRERTNEGSNVCLVFRDGECHEFWEDINAPERSTFGRHFSFVAEELRAAFEAGREVGPT